MLVSLISEDFKRSTLEKKLIKMFLQDRFFYWMDFSANLEFHKSFWCEENKYIHDKLTNISSEFNIFKITFEPFSVFFCLQNNKVQPFWRHRVVLQDFVSKIFITGVTFIYLLTGTPFCHV